MKSVSKSHVLRFALIAAVVAVPVGSSWAQADSSSVAVERSVVQGPVMVAANRDVDVTLPEAPRPQGAPEAFVLPQPDGYKSVDRAPVASVSTKYIPAGYMAQQRITARDKVVIGLRDLVNPLNFAGMFASSGYEQAVNGAPNYGTDGGAFGQRLGAAAIRETSQGVFTDTVFAPLLHEDPRYYTQGSGHSFLHRTVYSITRPFITRTDSGKNTVNGAMLLGYAGAAALSDTYYPKVNQNFSDTASSFAGSIGGAALGFFVSEFSTDLLQVMHKKKS